MRRQTAWIIAAAVLGISATSQAGFTNGNLIVADQHSVYSVDALTGNWQTLYDGYQKPNAPTFYDVAFNPVTGSAFLAAQVPGKTGRSIMELRWTGMDYQLAPFLETMDVATLTTDRAGNIYYNTSASGVGQRIFRATPAGVTQPISASPFGYLFVPTDIDLSPDESKLYIANSPTNDVEVLNLANSALSYVHQDIGFPNGLVAVGDTIYVAEGQDNYGILALTTTGVTTTFDQQPWMEFMKTGFWNDIDFDARTGRIVAGKADIIYGIKDGALDCIIFAGKENLAGLDWVVPEPTGVLLLPLGAIFALRRRRA